MQHLQSSVVKDMQQLKYTFAELTMNAKNNYSIGRYYYLHWNMKTKLNMALMNMHKY